MPPVLGPASKIVTWCPSRAISWAAVSPAGPAPITATFPLTRPGCSASRCSSRRDQREAEYTCSGPVPGRVPLSGFSRFFREKTPAGISETVSRGIMSLLSTRPGRRCTDSGPCRSVSTRLIGRMAIGSKSGPMSPRRQAVSHGAPQIRPQAVDNGFGSWEISYPNSVSPRAMAVT